LRVGSCTVDPGASDVTVTRRTNHEVVNGTFDVQSREGHPLLHRRGSLRERSDLQALYFSPGGKFFLDFGPGVPVTDEPQSDGTRAWIDSPVRVAALIYQRNVGWFRLASSLSAGHNEAAETRAQSTQTRGREFGAQCARKPLGSRLSTLEQPLWRALHTPAWHAESAPSSRRGPGPHRTAGFPAQIRTIKDNHEQTLVFADVRFSSRMGG
jgi:hypothetical protein